MPIPVNTGFFAIAIFRSYIMRPILVAYLALTIVLHLDFVSFPMALLPAIPRNDVEVIHPV